MINLFDISIQIRRFIKFFFSTLINLNIVLPLEVIIILVFLIGFYFVRKLVNTLRCNKKYSKKTYYEKNKLLENEKGNLSNEKLCKKLYMIKKLIKENIINKTIVITMVSEIKNNINLRKNVEKYNIYKNKNINSKVQKKLKSLEKLIKNKYGYDEIKSKFTIIVLVYYIDNKN